METTENLNQKLEHLEAQLEIKDTKIEELELLVKYYEEQLRLSRVKKFGSSSDKIETDNPEQLSLFNEAEAESSNPLEEKEPELETVTEDRRKKNKRGSFTKSLAEEVIEYDLPENEKVCNICGNELNRMKEIIRKELTFIPAQFKTTKIVTYVYSCRYCEKNNIETPIINAESPKALIPKSIASPSLLAYILYQKFTNAMPLYRMEQDFKRLGLDLSRQNLSNWVLKAANLLKPLLELLKIVLISQSHIHADETTAQVLHEPNRPATAKSYMWVYVTSEVCDNQVVVYEYTTGRASIFPQTFLADFNGTLQTDGYVGYKKLEPKLILCGCWAHLQRKIVDAIKIKKNTLSENSPEFIFLKFCKKLFKIESTAKKEELPLEELLKLRQEKSTIIIKDLYDWIGNEGQKILPKSVLGEAITYALNQKVYLLRFLDDPKISLTNNTAERCVKPFVIGRKNWLFSNTQKGATSSSIIYSVVQTAIRNNLNPLAYLNLVFKYIQINGSVNDELLPWSELVKNSCSISKN